MILLFRVSILLVPSRRTGSSGNRPSVASACAGRDRQRAGGQIFSFCKKKRMRHAQTLPVSSHAWADQRRPSTRRSGPSGTGSPNEIVTLQVMRFVSDLDRLGLI